MLCSKTNEKAEAVKAKNRGKAIALRPIPTLTVAQNDDPRFSSKRHEVLVLFDRQDTHRGGGPRSAFLLQGLVLTQRDTFKGAETLDSILFLVVALKPDVSIGMSCGKGLKEGGNPNGD